MVEEQEEVRLLRSTCTKATSHSPRPHWTRSILVRDKEACTRQSKPWMPTTVSRESMARMAAAKRVRHGGCPKGRGPRGTATKAQRCQRAFETAHRPPTLPGLGFCSSSLRLQALTAQEASRFRAGRVHFDREE